MSADMVLIGGGGHVGAFAGGASQRAGGRHARGQAARARMPAPAAEQHNAAHHITLQDSQEVKPLSRCLCLRAGKELEAERDQLGQIVRAEKRTCDMRVMPDSSAITMFSGFGMR